jgi:GNAT superfamily N-acetyltransferase
MATIVRPMGENDLSEAERIFRCAFGKQFRLENPMAAFGDADYVYGRWKAKPENAFVAEMDGRIVGSNFTTQWGTVGFFGPLTVDPVVWDKGIGKRLVAEAVHQFDLWEITHRGLFTFPESPKHISLYQKFGFWPRFLTALMELKSPTASGNPAYVLWSQLGEEKGRRVGSWCASVTDAIYRGLNVSSEIEAVARFSLGDTILLGDDAHLEGFAVCHCGRQTEGGTGTCYVKFAAVRPSAHSVDAFAHLVAACEHFAARRECERVACGMNYGRIEAVRVLVDRGFRTETLGVTMHGDNSAGYSLPGNMVIDDWR